MNLLLVFVFFLPLSDSPSFYLSPCPCWTAFHAQVFPYSIEFIAAGSNGEEMKEFKRENVIKDP